MAWSVRYAPQGCEAALDGHREGQIRKHSQAAHIRIEGMKIETFTCFNGARVSFSFA